MEVATHDVLESSETSPPIIAAYTHACKRTKPTNLLSVQFGKERIRFLLLLLLLVPRNEPKGGDEGEAQKKEDGRVGTLDDLLGGLLGTLGKVLLPGVGVVGIIGGGPTGISVVGPSIGGRVLSHGLSAIGVDGCLFRAHFFGIFTNKFKSARKARCAARYSQSSSFQTE